MEIEILKKGIRIQEDIDANETKLATLRKLYSTKEDLTYEDIEKLFAIAINGVDYTMYRLKEDLKKL